jgi:hypothetical protein
MENAPRSRKHMNRCSRLSVMIVVAFWAVVSPLVVSTEANRGPELSFQYCTDSAYQQYGSSDSPRFDINKYLAEIDTCSRTYAREGVRFPRVLPAMVGADDRVLGLAGWGFMLVPPALLWIVSWVIGRIVIWVAAAFSRFSAGSERTSPVIHDAPSLASGLLRLQELLRDWS